MLNEHQDRKNMKRIEYSEIYEQFSISTREGEDPSLGKEMPGKVG